MLYFELFTPKSNLKHHKRFIDLKALNKRELKKGK